MGTTLQRWRVLSLWLRSEGLPHCHVEVIIYGDSANPIKAFLMGDTDKLSDKDWLHPLALCEL